MKLFVDRSVEISADFGLLRASYKRYGLVTSGHIRDRSCLALWTCCGRSCTTLILSCFLPSSSDRSVGFVMEILLVKYLSSPIDAIACF